MCALLAPGEADHVAFVERPLALRRAEGWLSAHDDEPLLVGVVRVVRA
jgi:hypothetical protein